MCTWDSYGGTTPQLCRTQLCATRSLPCTTKHERTNTRYIDFDQSIKIKETRIIVACVDGKHATCLKRARSKQAYVSGLAGGQMHRLSIASSVSEVGHDQLGCRNQMTKCMSQSGERC